ncbi:hypothetical protein D3C73_723650 [compost metagenome]
MTEEGRSINAASAPLSLAHFIPWYSGEYTASGHRAVRTGKSSVKANIATGGFVERCVKWRISSVASLGPSISTAVG